MGTIRKYRVKYGDTLAKLAKHFYGNEELATFIYQHNRHYIQNVNLIYPGQIIVIPHVSPLAEVIKELL